MAAERMTVRTLLPGYRVQEAFTATGMPSVMTPWGNLQASALRGVRPDGTGFLVLMYENPTIWAQLIQPMPKKDLELLHLRKLAMDCRAASDEELFDEVIEMGETPDFRILTEGVTRGWEMTQLAIEPRRLAQKLFFEVTDRIAKLPRSKLRHLFGAQVYMWFGEANDASGLPFRKNDAEAYDKLVEAVVAYRVDPAHLTVTDDAQGIPDSFTPPLPVHDIEDVQFFAVPLQSAMPATIFTAMTGMNLGLAFQSEHVATDEWQQLRKMVRRKDKPSNDILVISAGAPDRMGRCFTTEEILAQLLIDHPEPLLADHLGAVILHFWSTGQAFNILGDGQPRLLWGASYSGISPAAQPILAPPTDDGEADAPAS